MNTISNERRFLNFTINDGQGEHEYSIPLLSSLPASYVRKVAAIAKLPEAERDEAYLDLQFSIFEEYAPGVLDIATASDLKDIMGLWMEAENMGESSASPD